jgi:hypothetical protein
LIVDLANPLKPKIVANVPLKNSVVGPPVNLDIDPTVAAAGLEHPGQLAPAHFSRRVSPHEVRSFADLYPPLAPGELIAGTRDGRFRTAWEMASAKEFRAVPAAA